MRLQVVLGLGQQPIDNKESKTCTDYSDTNSSPKADQKRALTTDDYSDLRANRAITSVFPDPGAC